MKLDNHNTDNTATASAASGKGKNSAVIKFEFYAIANSSIPGIYDNWPLAEKQVHRFSGAVHKGFQTKEAAESFMVI